MNSNRTSPSSPSSTVRPLKKTARPAVATVARTASATRSGPIRPERQLLAEPAGHQQRVVHAEPEPEQGREVEHEDAHRGQRRDDEDRRQRHDHRRAADHERHAGRDHRAEHQQQGQRRQRERDDLASPQVRLGHGLDVAVERRATGQLHRQGRTPAGGARAGSAGRRASRRPAGRGRRRRRRCGRRPRPGAAQAGARRPGRRAARSAMSRVASAAAASNAGVPAVSVSLLRTMTSADGGAPSSVPRSALARADSRSSRMKPPALSCPLTRGASGTATTSTIAQAATIHQARRTTNRPSRSKEVTSGFRLGSGSRGRSATW